MFEIFAIIVGTVLAGLGFDILNIVTIKMQDISKPTYRMVCTGVDIIGIMMVISGIMIYVGAIRSLFYS